MGYVATWEGSICPLVLPPPKVFLLLGSRRCQSYQILSIIYATRISLPLSGTASRTYRVVKVKHRIYVYR